MSDGINTSGGITLDKLQSRWITKTGSSLILFTRSFHHITGVTFSYSVTSPLVFTYMYCDKENVNILTALLRVYGVEHAVVCPGSRNATIVHNLNECPGIKCHSVVDERSAGFIALGLTIESRNPVVVCVTSGSALLNVMPAAAEATYQHRGIIVISADRPQAWIDQLDGQTLPQPGALGNFVGKCVNLPEITDDESRWHCRRLVCEAMVEWQYSGSSVHINVPISEPFFSFTTESLPLLEPILLTENSQVLTERLLKARRPMVVVGQCACYNKGMEMALDALSDNVVVVRESMTGATRYCGNADAAIYLLGEFMGDFTPDIVIYIGDHVVSKRIKKVLRNLRHVPVWHVSEHCRLQDVTMHMTGLLRVPSISSFANHLTLTAIKCSSFDEGYCKRWHKMLQHVTEGQLSIQTNYSQAMVVREFESMISNHKSAKVYYANSSAIRLANVFASKRVECNRGLNGIEGSLSTAVGAALAGIHEEVYCVIGDLSFFYDENALASCNGLSQFKVLLLNNGCGGIFHQLNGLENSKWRNDYIAASHNRSAEGICQQYGVDYMKVDNADSLVKALEWFENNVSDKARLLEVFTDAEVDAQEFKRLYNEISLCN